MNTTSPYIFLRGFVLSLSIGLAASCSGSDSSSAGTDGGGGGGGGDLLETGDGPCDDGSECSGDVCVALIDGNHPPVYCTQECGACPSDFYCDSDTFALAGLSFCRFGDTPTTIPDPPPEPPRIPCKGDDSCGTGLVCATFEGERDCTLACTDEAQCSTELQGITFDMHNCEADQTPGTSRDVCLPDPACFTNPVNCISGFPGI